MSASTPLKEGTKITFNGKPALGVGIVRFYGTATFQPGVWVGAELDNPGGKNDGSVKGQRYFTCEPNYGIFVKADQVTPVKAPAKKATLAPGTTAKSTSRTGSRPPSSVASSPTVQSPILPAHVAHSAPVSPLPSLNLDSASPAPTLEADVSSPVVVQSPAPSVSSPSVTSPAAITSPTMQSPATSAPPIDPNVRSERIDNLMRALKELSDFKTKAEEKIRGLQTKVKESNSQSEKSAKEFQKEKEALEKEISQLKKENEKQNAKSSKEWEAEKAEKEEQLTALNDTLEETTVDLQMAEEKIEDLETELEGVKSQLELLQAERSTSVGSEVDGDNAHELKEHNERLKAALAKIRDMSLAEKQEREKRIKELERENKRLPGMTEKIERLESELKAMTAENEELKEAVEVAGEAEEMIESLTEKNLDYEDKIEEYKTTIEELEQLRDMSEEIESDLQADVKRLESECHVREVQVLDLEGAIFNLNNKINDYERIVGQFRILVKSQQEQLSLIRQKEEETENQAQEVAKESQQLLNQNMELQSKMLKSTAVAIDQELAILNRNQSEAQFNFVKDFLPPQMFGGDYEALCFSLMVKRFIFKCHLVIQHVTHFNLKDEVQDEKFSEDEYLFYEDLRYLMGKITGISRDFNYALNRCNTELYLNLGRIFGEISPEERLLDHIIAQLREEELVPGSLDEIKNFATRYSQFANVSMETIRFPVHENFQREIADIIHALNEISIEERRLVNAVNKLNPQVEKEVLLNLPHARIRHNLEVARKLLKTLQDYEPQPSDVEPLSEKFGQAKKICEANLLAFRQVVKDIVVELSEKTEADLDEISQIIQKTLSKNEQMDVEWKWMDNLLSSSYTSLSEAASMLLLGVAILKEKSEKKIPYLSRAETVRAELISAASAKTKLEEKDNEILEWKKQNQLKENELRDSRWKEQALEAKISRSQKNEERVTAQLSEQATKHAEQEKMYTQAIDSISKDIDNLRAENKNLKDKNSQMEIEHQQKLEKEKETPELPLELVSAEIGTLKSTIKILRVENSKLNSQKAQKILEDLPPLSFENSAKIQSGNIGEISSCSKEISQLYKQVRTTLALPKVVNLKDSSTTPAVQLQSHRNEFDSLHHRLDIIRSRTNDIALKTSNANAPTNFSVFPTTEFSRTISELKPVPMGRINLNPTGNSTPVKVILDSQQFQQLHGIFVR
eukprot:TRINITY_DN462_c0_g2_i15.p1 TRINITY_DN462_c0_g2~~TRINITY_DN462_c0_g2_i15.p1  ORF type:complete len:1199 (+),score=563.72 TRINITY_DN462_c0_g2_i15:2380-5976(+)